MLRIRFRTRTNFIAIVAIAILAAFFRPDSHNDPTILSVAYCAVIVAGLIELLLYIIRLLRL
jgi:hypothetical protein